MKNKRIVWIAIIGILAINSSAIDYKTVPKTEKTHVATVIDYPYARDYILIGKGLWSDSVENIVKSDALFEQGNRMLSDPSQFISKTVPAALDPEARDKSTRVQSVADFENAIKKLAESAKTYQNPVSAYEAVSLSLRMYGKGVSNPIISDMPILTKLLYNYEVCESYILYGEQLEKSGNLRDAYGVYKNGMSNTKCSGWYQSVLGGKVSVMKKAVGL